MALFDLFQDFRPTIISTDGSRFIFDAVINATHLTEVDWTGEPIENGSVISDNRVVMPRRLSLVAIVSSGQARFPDRTRHVRAYQRLEALATASPARLFTVTTTLRTLRNVAILSISAPEGAEIGVSLQATMELEEKQVAFTAVAQNLADAAQDPGLAEVDLGTVGYEGAA